MNNRKRSQTNENGQLRQNPPRRCKEIQTHYAFDADFEENDVVPNTMNKRLSKRQEEDKNKEIMFLTILSWLIQMKVVKLYESIQYSAQGLVVCREGKLTPRGILCNCCNFIFPVFYFPSHNVKFLYDNKPYENMFIRNTGVSLLVCLIEAWNRHSVPAKDGYQHVVRKTRVYDNHDDACLICADGGELICCEKCPSTYHFKCMGFTEVPQQKWLCPYCCCKYCQRDDSFCTLLTCHQCLKKYHWECYEREDQISENSEPPKISLCGQRCWMLYKNLEGMVGAHIVLHAENGFSWSLVRRTDMDLTMCNTIDLHRNAKCNAMVVLSTKLMEDSFNAIVDRQTRANTIQSVVYNRGSNFTRTNFSRFYTAVLEHHGRIITVASLRIASPTISEIPLIATTKEWRNKGMCRLLLFFIEKKLREIGIEHIVIPSAPEMVSSWQRKFGFTPLDETLNREIRELNTLMFPTTTRLHKEIKMKFNHGPKEEQE